MRDPGQKRALNFLASVGEDGRVARLEEWNDLGLYLREPRARRAPTLLLGTAIGPVIYVGWHLGLDRQESTLLPRAEFPDGGTLAPRSLPA
jgi:hypothetical protein